MEHIAGKGSATTVLSAGEIREICDEALLPLSLKGKRVLVLIPDHTRHAPIDMFFRTLYDAIGREVREFNVLVATGTHQSMEEDHLYRHVGITAGEHRERFPNVHFSNHRHDDPARLTSIGVIPAAEIRDLTGGLFSEDINVTVNTEVLEHDHVIIVSPVVPHEAMGFAGGNKYFFPGVGGVGIIQTFHWLAAIITNPAVNGVKDTPTRRVIDRAAELVRVPTTCFAFAVNDTNQVACLFAGEPREAWSRAADCSSQLHIRYVDRPFRRILAVTPGIYEELWVAGKAMYKLEPVVADGGELIIYGPQVREISFVHGEAIRRIGYHVRDYFVKQWDRFAAEPKLILAHSTNVRGIGSYEEGVERPRIAVTLATSIPEDVCRGVNLGYRDPRTIDPARWTSGGDERDTVVQNAGQDLYRLRAG
jgi:nickel-dependent lactate racemase